MLFNPKKLPSRLGFKFYTPLAMLFVGLTLIVNIINQKVVPVGFGVLLTAGDFIYPLVYVISVLLTEVYGYALSRRIIWLSWGFNLIGSGIIGFAIALPAASAWTFQESFATILGRAPLMLLASFIAFIVGEFVTAYILAKLKIYTSGKYLWLRTLGAISVGQALDTIIFEIIAFWQILSFHQIMILSLACYSSKIIYQMVLTPVLSWLANFIKRKEQVDIFDRDTNFNPFRIGIE